MEAFNTVNNINRLDYSVCTYNDERKCLQCGKPIADHEHAARKFCDKYSAESGKVYDCKTTYHRINDKLDREIHGGIIRDQKFFSNQITDMIAKKGFEVTTDDLNAYDIQLAESLKLEIKSNGMATSHFLQYIITSNPITNKHKITRHEQQ